MPGQEPSLIEPYVVSDFAQSAGKITNERLVIRGVTEEDIERLARRRKKWATAASLVRPVVVQGVGPSKARGSKLLLKVNAPRTQRI